MDTSHFSSSSLLLLLLMILHTSSDLTTDVEALLAFKKAITSDPTGVVTTNWSTITSICSWTGVSCSTRHPTRVTALDLSGLQLRGTIAPHLGNLTFLQSLDISNNSFRGDIPPSLFTNMPELMEINMRVNQLSGQLPNDMCRNSSKLQRIFLSRNHFYGRIPARIYQCRMLEDLRLNVNQFSGNIPAEIGNLTMFTSLALPSNFLQGNIPASIFNNSLLEYVDLFSNNLSGSIPLFSNSPKLEELYLSNNHLTGHIPKEVGNLTLLKEIDVSFNKLAGELPKELGNLAYLEVLAAPFNDLLNGSIPSSIFNISTLITLALQQNQFSGTLPPTMGLSLPNLQNLSLFLNRLSGEIPSSIANASKLTMLELNRNSFHGPIPDFGNLRLLQYLRLWENNLTGEESSTQELRFLSALTNCQDLKTLEISNNSMMNGVIPASVGNLSTSLVTFAASACSIRGAIPSELGNLTSLQTVDLSRNRLEGLIPRKMGRLELINKLYLYENQLGGYIPQELCQMSSLGELLLFGNNLIGPIPECFGEVKSLRDVSFASNNLNSTLPTNLFNLQDIISLDLSSNYLSGQLPQEIGNLKVVNKLDLSSNKFSGVIPSSIRSCESLEFLYLSNNEFNGTIPESLGEAKGLVELDLSSNNLSGVIPTSLEKLDLQLFNVSYNQLEGEIPDGGNFSNFSAESFAHNLALCGAARFEVPPCLKNHARSRSRNVDVVMKYVIPPFIAALILIIAIVMIITKRRRLKKASPPSADISSVGAPWKIISERQLTVGTSSFSEINLLGKGSFGSVYKAVVDDETVAVKVFNLGLEGAFKSFETESRILSTIRHRNLVRVLGCCSNEQFKALILAYMPNGSLDKWIHSESYGLDLVQRLNIALDVALALEYLHHNHTFTVVHCDIKPNNVLLDQDMTAHVADFGISKLFESGEVEAHTLTMATIGYAAPELGSQGKVTTSMDVYSYGILLLEMFTSKKPTDDAFNEEMSIKQWVEKGLQEKGISEVVAPGLLSREDRRFAAKEECVSSIFDLATKCLAFLPDERINMMQVVACLQKLKVGVEGVKRRHSGSR